MSELDCVDWDSDYVWIIMFGCIRLVLMIVCLYLSDGIMNGNVVIKNIYTKKSNEKSKFIYVV